MTVSRFLASAATAVAFLLAAPVARAQTTLRVVMNSDLKIIDPIWTSAYIVRDHGYMIYDTLFAMDDKGEIQLQMLEAHTISADQLTHTLTLRDGLEWHDGAPVTAEDCIASIRRWAAKDGMGQVLMTFVTDMIAKDSRTIELKLKAPTGLVRAALGKPSSNVPFMMPKRVAETDPNKQIADTTGSGPFEFKRDEWKPGDKVVYLKNAKYKPRNEPPSGVAGGKVVHVDRVEWRAIADAQQAVNGLLAGEIDYLERPPHDLLPLIAKEASVAIHDVNRYGAQYALRPNHLVKPFDHPKVREALWYALNQEDFLNATIGNPKYYLQCLSAYPCRTGLETKEGMEGRLTSDMKRAGELLREGGYDGSPIVLLHSTDLSSLTNMAPVAKQLLEKAGFKVDMQSMDWQSVVARRTKKDPVAAGGWNIFITSISAVDILDPIMNPYFNSTGAKANVGWPDDPEMEALRAKFASEPDAAKQKALAVDIQKRMLQATPYVHLGQFFQPIAVRKAVSGVLSAPVPVLWNLKLEK